MLFDLLMLYIVINNDNKLGRKDMDYKEKMYEKWRSEMFRICVVLAAIGSVAEIVIYLYDASHSTLFLPKGLYRARFIYIPSSLNLIVITVTYLCINSKNLTNSAKNVWACILIYFLCANTQVIHYVYGPLLMLPCVAICMSVLFSNKKLTLGMLLASIASLIIAWHQAAIELRKDDPQLTIDILLAALVMGVTYTAARMLIGYNSEQMNYILNSNDRQKVLIEECNIDALMGIGNRRALTDKLEKVLTSEFKVYTPQLVMLDIDNFKKVNDTYGHLSGDDVLIALSHMIKEHIKGKQIDAYRYGGEEIVLLCFGQTPDALYDEVNYLRKDFSHIKYPFAPGLEITFSGGMAEMEKDDDADSWIARADEFLYAAKSQVKNRINR